MTQEMTKILKKAGALLEDAFQYMLTHDCQLPFDFMAKNAALWKTTHPDDYRQKYVTLLKHPRYVYVAVRYFECQGFSGTIIDNNIPLQYKLYLAKVYGIRVFSPFT
ncbi:MAG: hypothetical protein IJS08_12260, partial [Victivallales bacterium]|nr:hypothetical protein [Victivallales bacterium]